MRDVLDIKRLEIGRAGRKRGDERASFHRRGQNFSCGVGWRGGGVLSLRLYIIYV